MRRLLSAILGMMLATTLAHAQGLDQFGGVIGWKCPAETSDPYPVGHPFTAELSYTVSSVARASGTSTITFSGPTNLQVGTWITITGTTPDSGSFNSAANNVWTIASLSNSNPYTITFAQTGNTVSTTASVGTVQEAFWYLNKIGSRWVECDPVGNARWHEGVNFNAYFPGIAWPTQNGSSSAVASWFNALYNNSMPAWGAGVDKQLLSMGFNATSYLNHYVTPWDVSSPQFPAETIGNMGLSSVYYTALSVNHQIFSPQAAKDFLRGVDRTVSGYYQGTATEDSFDPNFLIYQDGGYYGYMRQASSDYHNQLILNPWAEMVSADDGDNCFGCRVGTQIPISYFSFAGPDPAWSALTSTPVEYASWVYAQGEYSDATVYVKHETISWLQGQGDDALTMVTSATCNSSGNAATYSVYQNWFNVGDHVWVYGMTPSDLSIAQATPATITAVGASSFTASITCTANENSTVQGEAISVLTQPLSASSNSSGVVTLSFTVNPFHAGNANVDGDVISVTGMTPSCFNTTAGTGAVVKSATPTALTYQSSCASAQSATVVGPVGSGPGYTAISQLNTNWGTSSFYTSFGTTGTAQTYNCGNTGTSQTAFSCTVPGITTSNPIDNMSVYVTIGGTFVAGSASLPQSASNGAGCTSGVLWGPNLNGPGSCGYSPASTKGGTIQYGINPGYTGDTSLGKLTWDLSSAPASGQPIIVHYTTGGYGHGTGLLDENGRNSRWLGNSNPTGNLNWQQGAFTGANAGVLTDMGHWRYHYAYWQFNQDRQAISRYAHHGIINFGLDVIGGHNGVPWPQFVLADAQNNDIIYSELGTDGVGWPPYQTIASDSCSSNTATITVGQTLPAWFWSGQPLTITGTSNDGGAFNSSTQDPWKIASISGNSITFSQTFGGAALSCANLSTTADSGKVYLDVRQQVLNYYYQEAGDFPMMALLWDEAGPDTEFYNNVQIGTPSSPGYGIGGGEMAAVSEEEKGALLDSWTQWALNAQPLGDSNYPIVGYNLDGWVDGIDSTGKGYGFADTCGELHDGNEGGQAYGIDAITGYPYGGCPGISTRGRQQEVNYSGSNAGYLFFFIAPGSIPAAGTPITVTYTSSSTQYTETIATSDGVSNGWYYWTAHTPITAGTVTIKAGATTLGTDNGSGLLSGSGLVANGSPYGDAITGVRKANGEWLKTIVNWPVGTTGAVGGNTP